ncbi:MAG: vanadium-dependent haloperoxidase [Chitinophagaceae bacterium]
MKLPLMRRNQRTTSLLMVSLFSLLFSCQKKDHWPPKATQESADVVHDWYKLLIRLQLHQNPAPFALLNMSNFGYIGVGLYESVHPGIKGSTSLSTKLYQMPTMPAAAVNQPYLWSASANAALASMSRLLLAGLTDANKDSIDSLERVYNERFTSGTTEAVLSRSQAFGHSIATAIHNWSKTDNLNISNAGYVRPVFPGAWEPTPPAFANPAGPYIGNARPFLESNLTVTAPPFPFPYSEDPSSEFYKMVKEVYDISKVLTPEQRDIARFWADVGGPGNGYPVPGHFVSIVTQVLEKNRFNLGRSAELYAKTAIANRDALINMWRFKFHYNTIRPVTYINRFIDPAWQTLVLTPPYPEYPSALTYILGSAMQVLTRELGDNIPVTDNTYTFNGSAPRHYSSFTKVVEEGAISRFYGGIHYKIVVEMSLPLAKEIGDKAADIDLTGDKHKLK